LSDFNSPTFAQHYFQTASSRAAAVFGVCPPLKSVAYYARQCFSLLNPAFDRVDAGYFVDVFLLAVNSREFFVEMISSPLRQFFDRVYAGASEKLRVLPADSLDSKEISFVDPFLKSNDVKFRFS